MAVDHPIPIIEMYRGVAIHDEQPTDRIERTVKPAIDRVLMMTDEYELFAVARDVVEPPEARLLAAAKVAASFEIAAEERRNRPRVDLTKVRAAVAGVGSQRWRHHDFFCSLLDAPNDVRRRAVRRQPPS